MAVGFILQCAASAGVVVNGTSLQPNQPLLVHVVVAGSEVVGSGSDVVIAVVVLSLQPNQPGVSQVVVDVGANVVVDSCVFVVVVGSLQPHHPGVLHVSVRVRVLLVLVGKIVVVVLVLVPSSYFQRKQSTQVTSSSTQVAALSYFEYTLSIAYRRL